MFQKLFGLGALALVLITSAAGQSATNQPATSQPASQDGPLELKKLRAKLQADMQAQDWPGVVVTSEAILAQQDKDPQAWHHLGYALHAQGKLEEALKAHLIGAELPSFGATCAYNAACVYSLQGNTDAAFEWLTKAQAKGFADASVAKSDPDLANIRGDARFADFVKALAAGKGQAASARGASEYQLYAYPTKRSGFRVAFFDQSAGSPGQIALDHGVLAWQDKYDAAIGSGKLDGQRWRLGKDFWTRLDTSFDLTVGGVPVPVGDYYLTLERSAEGAYTLAFNDPAKVRAAKIDPFVASRTTGGIEVGMAHAALESKADTLTISMAMKADNPFKGELSIRFGGHELTAPVVIQRGAAGS